MSATRSVLLLLGASGRLGIACAGGFFQADAAVEQDDPFGLLLLVLNLCFVVGFLVRQHRQYRAAVGEEQKPEERHAETKFDEGNQLMTAGDFAAAAQAFADGLTCPGRHADELDLDWQEKLKTALEAANDQMRADTARAQTEQTRENERKRELEQEQASESQPKPTTQGAVNTPSASATPGRLAKLAGATPGHTQPRAATAPEPEVPASMDELAQAEQETASLLSSEQEEPEQEEEPAAIAGKANAVGEPLAADLAEESEKNDSKNENGSKKQLVEKDSADDPWQSDPWTFADINKKLFENNRGENCKRFTKELEEEIRKASVQTPRSESDGKDDASSCCSWATTSELEFSRPHLNHVLRRMFPKAKDADIEQALDEIGNAQTDGETKQKKCCCLGKKQGSKKYKVHELHHWLANEKRHLLVWKGIAVDAFDKAKEQETWLHFCLGIIQSYSLPAMTLEHLGARLGKDSVQWRAWTGGGGLMTILSVWSILAPNYFASISPAWSFVALALYYGVLMGILSLFIRMTRSDLEWTDIDDFLDHREVRWGNKENYNALADQGYLIISLMALTFRVMPTPAAGAVVDTAEEDISSYTAFKMGVKKWFDAALFQFDIDINTPDVDIDVDMFELSVWISIAAVVLWWVMFGGVMLRLTMNLGDDSTSVQERFQLYQKLRQGGSLVYYPYTWLSGSLMISVLSNLMKTMDCTTDPATGIPTLDANGWVCWGYGTNVRAAATARCTADCMLMASNSAQCFNVTDMGVVDDCTSACEAGALTEGSQQKLATLSLLLILFYTVTTVLLAPFVVADSDGIFQPEKLDIRFSARFQLAERSGKLMLTAMTIFFGQRYPGIVLIVQFDVYMFMWNWTETSKPCSILWMNAVRSAAFGLSALTSLCIAFDISTHFNRSPGTDAIVEWLPFIVFIIGMVINFAVLAHRIREILRRGGGNLAKTEATKQASIAVATSNTRNNCTEFDDSASLRGYSHRLTAVNIDVAWRKPHRSDGTHNTEGYTDDTRILGLEAEYEMDGVSAQMPPHGPTREWRDLAIEGWEKVSVHFALAKEERITAFQLHFSDGENGSSTAAATGLSLTVAGGAAAADGVLEAANGVLEEYVFFGRCPHCKQFEPALSRRLIDKPKTSGIDGMLSEAAASSRAVGRQSVTRCHQCPRRGSDCKTRMESDLVDLVAVDPDLQYQKAVAFFGRCGAEGLFELGAVVQKQTPAERKQTDQLLAAKKEATKKRRLEKARKSSHQTGLMAVVSERMLSSGDTWSSEEEYRTAKPFMMNVIHPGCFKLNKISSHEQNRVMCEACNFVICNKFGPDEYGRAELSEDCSFRAITTEQEEQTTGTGSPVSSDAGEGSKEEGRDDRPEQLGRQQQEEEDLGQQQLPAVGAASQDYIVIPAGPTGASPDASGLFQAQNIATKIAGGQIEVLSETSLVSPGQLVSDSDVQLLAEVDKWRYVPIRQWEAAHDERERAAAAAESGAAAVDEPEVDLTPVNVADDY